MEEIAKRFLELANNPEVAEAVNFILAFLIGTYFLMYFSLSLIDFLYESAHYFYHRRKNALVYNEVKEREMQDLMTDIRKNGITDEKIKTLGLYLYMAEDYKRDRQKRTLYKKIKDWIKERKNNEKEN